MKQKKQYKERLVEDDLLINNQQPEVISVQGGGKHTDRNKTSSGYSETGKSEEYPPADMKTKTPTEIEEKILKELGFKDWNRMKEENPFLDESNKGILREEVERAISLAYKEGVKSVETELKGLDALGMKYREGFKEGKKQTLEKVKEKIERLRIQRKIKSFGGKWIKLDYVDYGELISQLEDDGGERKC